MSRSLSYGEALKEATAQEMRRDPSVIVLGMGVDDFQGIYGTTKDLAAEFGRQRVFDTPLSEDGMTGVAIGAALGGLRPIHVHIRMDFLLLAMNQIVNVAAKARYMYGGAVSVPIVIRAIIGRSWGQGAQHSQGLHSFFMHVPGLRVVAPTTPHDAKGCLISAIRDADPVIFVEHRMLHALHGAVPEESYEAPIGKARVLAPGRDVTLVGISYMAVECLRARDARRFGNRRRSRGPGVAQPARHGYHRRIGGQDRQAHGRRQRLDDMRGERGDSGTGGRAAAGSESASADVWASRPSPVRRPGTWRTCSIRMRDASRRRHTRSSAAGRHPGRPQALSRRRSSTFEVPFDRPPVSPRRTDDRRTGFA